MMTFIPFFHVGFLVNDLDKAMETFGSVFGVTWTVPDIGTVAAWEKETGNFDLGLKVAYSKQGPPYVELLQSQDSGLYAASQGEGFHHVGLWEPDCEGRQDEFIAQGMDPIHTQFDQDGSIIVTYFDPDKLHGVMLELVDEGRKPIMETWWSSESQA